MKKNNDPYIKNKCKETLSFYNQFCFYSTFNYNKKEEKNHLFKTSKSTNNKKSDLYISKSTKYTSSGNNINTFRNKLFNYNTIQNKKDNKMNNYFCYSSNLWNNNKNNSRIFSSKLLSNNKNKLYKRKFIDDNKKTHIFYFANSSLSKSTKNLKIILY